MSIIEMAHKSCFVVSPIGDEGSEIRHRSDQIFNYVITIPSPKVEKERGLL